MRARIRFEPSGRIAEVAVGTLLADAVGQAGLPLARGCSREALCGGCAVRLLEGGESLAPASQREADAKRRNRVSEDMRLACCVVVPGDLVVTARYW
jgi:adenylate cyclase